MTYEVISFQPKTADVLYDPIGVSADAVDRRVMSVRSVPRQINCNEIALFSKPVYITIPLSAAPHETMNKDKGRHFR